MKPIASITVIALVVACAMAMAPQSTRPQAARSATDQATTYEHLATAIIAMRETEISLVRGMLETHLAHARANLEAAADASGTERGRRLEAAATEITNLANEGDKGVQAVRQRLLKAGHHHHTDSETQDDYLFIDSREKKALLALAGEVVRMRQARPEDVRGASQRLTALVEEATKGG